MLYIIMKDRSLSAWKSKPDPSYGKLKGEETMKKMLIWTSILAITLAGCATQTQTGALVGTGVGAAVGAGCRTGNRT